MKPIIHLIAAFTATLCIATFFTSTLLVELFGTHETIAVVKNLIVMPGLFILIPAMAITGATGFTLSKVKSGKIVKRKLKRMPFIAANGLLVLLPAAIMLNLWAASGLFDSRFYIVQGIELIAGAVNLTLMSLNIRDGFKVSGKLRK
jgi:hypothetical protein